MPDRPPTCDAHYAHHPTKTWLAAICALPKGHDGEHSNVLSRGNAPQRSEGQRMTEPKLTEAQEDRWFQLQGEGLSSRAIAARMVATAEQTARAEAWDEGHRLTAPHSDRCEPTCPNPYRSTP